jgi:cytochrome c oxidase subunit 2
MVQEKVWLISLTLMGLLAAVFIFVYSQSHVRQSDYTPLQERAYRLRAVFFWLLVFTLGPAAIYTLFDLPYGGARASTAGNAQVIDAVAHQWRWEISRTEVALGQPVEFRVTSADVNHGFGIYDAGLHLVAQTQAMPGYTNTLRHTFDREGTYRILCMEYCGLVHHNMITEIQVVKR